MIRINYLITGKKGFINPIWNKFKNAPFAAGMKEANRDMNGYECCIIDLEAMDGIEGHQLLKDTIGKILTKKYEIQSI